MPHHPGSDRAAAERDDAARTARYVSHRGGLSRAKACLALAGEDLRDAPPGGLLDAHVEVDEREPEEAREQRSHRRFARAGQSAKVDVPFQEPGTAPGELE